MNIKRKISIILVISILVSIMTAYIVNAAGTYTDDVINNGMGTSYDLSEKERKNYYNI